MCAVPNRHLCSKCLRPVSICYCSDLQPFDVPFQLVILQHPVERKKGIGTARMAHLSINRSKLIFGKSFAQDSKILELISDPKYFAAVLFPSTHAFPLDASQSWLPPDKQLLLFVIDGTWAQAKRMLKLSPFLSELPFVTFNTERTSEYQIRKQPQSHCLSTLESIHEVIRILDPKTDTRSMLSLFNRMVDRQLHYGKLNLIRRKKSSEIHSFDKTE